LVHVMWNRPHVVEELGINRPPFVFVPNSFADDIRAAFCNSLLQSEPLFAHNAVTQPFVRLAILVRCWRRGREPAFVNATAVQAEGVEVVRMKLESFAWLKERARDPARRESEQSTRIRKRSLDERFDVFGDSFQCGN